MKPSPCSSVEEHLITNQGVGDSSPSTEAMTRPTKILVTGDREWDDIERVVEALSSFPTDTIVVHGACRGADVTCAAVAESLGFVVRSYPADWRRYPRAAGPIRNQQMIDEEHLLEEPIDVCLAFHNDIRNSRGTADMVRRATKASVPVIINTSHPRSSAD